MQIYVKVYNLLKARQRKSQQFRNYHYPPSLKYIRKGRLRYNGKARMLLCTFIDDMDLEVYDNGEHNSCDLLLFKPDVDDYDIGRDKYYGYLTELCGASVICPSGTKGEYIMNPEYVPHIPNGMRRAISRDICSVLETVDGRRHFDALVHTDPFVEQS